VAVEQARHDRRSINLKEQSMLNRMLATLGVMAVLTVVVSCGGAARTEPTATAGVSPTVEAPPSPTVVVRPPPPPTGIAEVDAVVRATLVADVDAIMGLVGYERLGCVIPEQEGSPPGCRTAEAPGTMVDAFPVVACGGTYERPEDARRSVDAVVRLRPLELYSVFRPTTRPADYRVVFDYAGAPDRHGFTFEIKDRRITGLYPTCGTVVDETRYLSEFIVPPPYGPHARAPRHLQESSIAEFVPTPYNTFIVTGTFDRTIDEVGDTDPFAWSVPASLVYDGKASWWRMYWQRGDIFDCAEDCSVALTQADAEARLKALQSGDPVCVVGWTDDVGNADAEAVYLRPPTPCTLPPDFFQRPTAACLLDPHIAGQRVAMIDYPTRQVTVGDVSGSSAPLGTVVVIPAETRGSSYAYSDPTLAPSGTALVIGANMLQPDGTMQTGLWEIALNGGAQRLIYPTEDATADANRQTFGADAPAYSPDGKRIAFTRILSTWRLDHGHDDHLEVWVIDADGSNPRKVVDGRNPRWSDDGRYLAYDTQSVSGPALAQAVVDANEFTPAPPIRLGPC
jgi:hypothetical protein